MCQLVRCSGDPRSGAGPMASASSVYLRSSRYAAIVPARLAHSACSTKSAGSSPQVRACPHGLVQRHLIAEQLHPFVHCGREFLCELGRLRVLDYWCPVGISHGRARRRCPHEMTDLACSTATTPRAPVKSRCPIADRRTSSAPSPARSAARRSRVLALPRTRPTNPCAPGVSAATTPPPPGPRQAAGPEWRAARLVRRAAGSSEDRQP
jgi:hypothetical protein